MVERVYTSETSPTPVYGQFGFREAEDIFCARCATQAHKLSTGFEAIIRGELSLIKGETRMIYSLGSDSVEITGKTTSLPKMRRSWARFA